MSNLTQDFSEKVVAMFCPTTKVKITDGSDGVYLTKINEIHCGKDWSVSGLLHEIAHAKYYLEENKTGHDGRYADILTQITDEYMNSGICYLYQDSKSKTTPWLADDFLSARKELECTRKALYKAKQDLEIARKAADNSREKLAAFMHDTWGNWFAYQLNNSTVENLQRWGIQSNTPYSSLSETDKDKDRKFADKIIEIIKEQIEHFADPSKTIEHKEQQ